MKLLASQAKSILVALMVTLPQSQLPRETINEDENKISSFDALLQAARGKRHHKSLPLVQAVAASVLDLSLNVLGNQSFPLSQLGLQELTFKYE